MPWQCHLGQWQGHKSPWQCHGWHWEILKAYGKAVSSAVDAYGSPMAVSWPCHGSVMVTGAMKIHGRWRIKSNEWQSSHGSATTVHGSATKPTADIVPPCGVPWRCYTTGGMAHRHGSAHGSAMAVPWQLQRAFVAVPWHCRGQVRQCASLR